MVDNQTLKELKAEKSALSSTVVKRQKEADALQEQVRLLARGDPLEHCLPWVHGRV